MYSVSVYLATITVVQSPFSLQGEASRQGGGCESSPLASQDREMLSTQPPIRPPTGLHWKLLHPLNCALKQDLPACLCICQNSHLKSLSCYRGVFWCRKAFSSAASSILMSLQNLCLIPEKQNKTEIQQPNIEEKLPFSFSCQRSVYRGEVTYPDL